MQDKPEKSLSGTESKKDPFPYSLFFFIFAFYMMQPFYLSYIRVYQSGYVGMTKTQIGLVGAGIALIMFAVKPVIGAVTDKSRNKYKTVSWLLFFNAAAVLFFYFSYLFTQGSFQIILLTAVCMLFYQIFNGTATTLSEANGVEILNERKGKWHSGHIRLGGTIGFMASALIGSQVIAGNHFERMFVIVSAFCIICGIWALKLPKVTGKARKKEKVPFSEIFKNRPFLVMLLLQFTNSMGMIFFQYYNIYLTDTIEKGGLAFDGSFIGYLSFCNAVLEIPIFWYARQIRDKIGIKWFMFIAVMINAAKFFLFSFLHTPWIILAVTVMTGFSFVGIHFCTVNFLNDHMPKKMRSTAQAFSGLVAQVMGAIVVGAMGGWLADTYSVPVMLRSGAFVVAAGGFAFYILFGKAMNYHNKHYGPNMIPLGLDGQPLYLTDETGNIIEEISTENKIENPRGNPIKQKEEPE